MLKRIKSMLTAIGVFSIMAAPFSLMASATVYAADANGVGIENCLASGSSINVNSDCQNTSAQDSDAEGRVNNILTLVVNIFSAIVGFIAVVMIIFGGVKYITSGGESSNISSAKNTIVYAIIGLIIVALAQILVKFVLSKVANSGSGTGGA